MRHRIAIAVAFSSFLAVLFVAGRAAADEAPLLRLVWIDVLDRAPFAFPLAAREATEILAEAGVATAWTLATPSTETTAEELSVLILEAPVAGSRLYGRIMGSTHRGGYPRVSWVYVSAVVWALGLEAAAARGLLAREREEVSRALGRVVAHEIVHALAPDLPHSGDGLMAGCLSRGRLVRGRVSLTPREARALRAGLESFKTMK